MRGAPLLDWLSGFAPAERDAAVEQYLGLGGPLPDASPPGADLIGYHASSVAAIVRALLEVPVLPEDVLIDLGAGLGKVVLLAQLLTGASAHGVELQPALVTRAREAAARLGSPAQFGEGDARNADLGASTVFYLYAPFTGPALRDVLQRLQRVAKRHAIVVCALGMDLGREASWLAPRPTDSFWLTLYDSVVAGVPARPPGASQLETAARCIACGQPRTETSVPSGEAGSRGGF